MSKTIPIWCSVINRLLFPKNPAYHDLYTPPQVVSSSEHAQIAALLPSFVSGLRSLDLPTSALSSGLKPLRPVWVTPESHLPVTAGENTIFEDFHPVICCTVSHHVAGGEVSEGGYIQGAGDDTENWACGLTPSIFWNNQEALLSTPESGLPDAIAALIQGTDASASTSAMWTGCIGTCITPTSTVFIAPTTALPAVGLQDENTVVIAIHSKTTDQRAWFTSPSRLDIGLGQHKLGSRNLRMALPQILEFAWQILSTNGDGEPPKSREMETKETPRLIITCESGRDFSIGVALAILCLLFDRQGAVVSPSAASCTVAEIRRTTKIDKTYIRQRLGWLSTSMPDANPSRATLQSVNSYLMPNTTEQY